MSHFNELFQRIEVQRYSIVQSELSSRSAASTESAPVLLPEPTPYVIDTTTISGALTATFVDIRFIYRYVVMSNYPCLVSIQYMSAKPRTRDSPEVEWYTSVPPTTQYGFKHQTSFVIAVDERAIDVKLFCNGKINIVGALSIDQAKTAVQYVIRMVHETSRETRRPCFDMEILEETVGQEYLQKTAMYSNKFMRKLKKEQHQMHDTWFQRMKVAPSANQEDVTDVTDITDLSALDGHISSIRSHDGMTVSLHEESKMCTIPFDGIASPTTWIPVRQFAHCEITHGTDPDPVSISLLNITNIHCVYSIQRFINRYALYELIRSMYADRYNVTFDPQKFPAVKLKSLEHQGTVFLFQQGKIVMTGMNHHHLVELIYQQINELLVRHWDVLYMNPPAVVRSTMNRKKKRKAPCDDDDTRE